MLEKRLGESLAGEWNEADSILFAGHRGLIEHVPFGRPFVEHVYFIAFDIERVYLDIDRHGGATAA